MNTLNVIVRLENQLHIELAAEGIGNVEFVTEKEKDAASNPIRLGENTVAEVIYRADVQPCIVLGLRSEQFDEARVTSMVNTMSRLVIAVGNPEVAEEYNDPVVDVMLSDGQTDNVVKLSADVSE